MDKHSVKFEEIKETIPHRYENVLMDRAEIYKENDSRMCDLYLTLDENDEHGRDIFLKKQGDDTVVTEHAYMEILALGTIVSMKPLPENVTVYFSAITNYKKIDHIKAGEVLTGITSEGRSKGDFYRFKGKIVNPAGNEIVSASLMAFGMQGVAAETDESEKNKIEIPGFNLDIAIDKSIIGWKSADMFFADKVKRLSDNDIVTEYIYPEDHPFTKGHFPNNPVMMGVTQWIAGSDAVWLFVNELDELRKSNKISVTCDINVIKENGVIATEIKKCTSEIAVKDGELEAIDVVEMKKLYFRDIVKPKDKLYIHAYNITIN